MPRLLISLYFQCESFYYAIMRTVVFIVDGFLQPMPFQYWYNISNAHIYLCFFKALGHFSRAILAPSHVFRFLQHIWRSGTRREIEICGHYNDVIMGAMASQITSITIVYSTIYSDQRKYQSSASLVFVQGIHRLPVNSPHKWPETRKMFSIWCRHHGVLDLQTCYGDLTNVYGSQYS